MAIRAISFDFWDTAYLDSRGEERDRDRLGYLKEQIASVVDVEERTLERLYSRAVDDFNVIWRERNRTINATGILRIIFEGLRLKPKGEIYLRVLKRFEESLLDIPPSPAPHVAEVLPELQRRFSLGINSDTSFSRGRVLRQLLERDRLLLYFSSFVFSDEEGLAKPNRSLFQAIRESFGVKNGEILHVGDNERTDVRGAKACGFRAAPYVPPGRSPFPDTQADWVIRDWRELPEIMK